jgi:hypothetical protein
MVILSVYSEPRRGGLRCGGSSSDIPNPLKITQKTNAAQAAISAMAIYCIAVSPFYAGFYAAYFV